MNATPLKVLVVDDEPPIRKLLRMGLGTQGYQTMDAPNAKTALDLMANQPDLVILDLGLPDMQGLELLRQIRSRTETVPIVVLSSRGDEVTKVEALDLGADDYVTKPFGMEELLARIRAALRHQLQVQGERPIFELDDLSVDLVRRIVKVRGKQVKLSPKEYDCCASWCNMRERCSPIGSCLRNFGLRPLTRNIFASMCASSETKSSQTQRGHSTF
jgi:two-component system KDP operon response regulator KdpE